MGPPGATVDLSRSRSTCHEVPLGYPFTLTCTSAAAERVFSLVEAITGPDQVRMLADQLQAGAMLRYNKRMVG